MTDWGMLFDLSQGHLPLYLGALVAAYFGGYKFGVAVRFIHDFNIHG